MKLYILSTIFALASGELVINSFMTSVKAGEERTITWSYDGTPPIGKMTLDVVDGDPKNLKFVATIASDVDPNAKSIKWVVPEDFANKGDYAIRAKAVSPEVGTVLRFTSPFVVEGGSPSEAPKSPGPSQTPTPTSVRTNSTSSSSSSRSTSTRSPTLSPGSIRKDDDSSAQSVKYASFGAFVAGIWALL